MKRVHYLSASICGMLVVMTVLLAGCAGAAATPAAAPTSAAPAAAPPRRFQRRLLHRQLFRQPLFHQRLFRRLKFQRLSAPATSRFLIGPATIKPTSGQISKIPILRST